MFEVTYQDDPETVWSIVGWEGDLPTAVGCTREAMIEEVKQLIVDLKEHINQTANQAAN